MYLKRVELFGFKSFADRIELQFQPGITAIIGPNGSGKSNISDAIKWVLGEQSAKLLRGSKMQDIIFIGSDKRKALGLAEVTLVLDNSDGSLPVDFAEVSVGRRVYRSGEGEYYINKTPCRLKDIHDLFMDTGIGREGYSIVEQGRVDEILNSRPEERRSIFEEAAGVMKYKTRKAEAMRKLEDTRYNLLRVGDIITELERQIHPLKEQAEKATAYLGLSERLRELEITLLGNGVVENEGRISKLKGEITRIDNEITEKSSLRNKADAEIETLKLRIDEISDSISATQQSIFENRSNVEKLEGTIGITNERLRSLESDKGRLLAEEESLRRRLAAEEGRLSEMRKELESLDELIRKDEEALRDKELLTSAAESGIGEINRRIEAIKVEVIDILSEISKNRNSISDFNARIESGEKLEARIRGNLDGLTEELDRGTALLEEKRASLSGCLALRAAEEEKRRALVAERDELEKELGGLRERKESLVSRRDSSLSRHVALEELERNYEGFYRGVKNVMRWSSERGKSGICGVIADVISVPEEYETAVEVALGGSLQDIITETAEDAREAVDYLKRSGGGRATFLPLDLLRSVDNEGLRREIGGKAGIIGLAVDLIGFPAKYKKAIDYVLGRTVVARDLEAAISATRSMKDKPRFVTLDGDLINPGGSITGGSEKGKSSGIVSRKREIQELKERIDADNARIAEVSAKIAETERRIAETVKAIAAADDRCRELNLAAAKAENELEQCRREQQRLEREIAGLNMELERLAEEREGFANSIKECRSAIEELAAKHKELEDEERSISQQLGSYRDQLTGHGKEITELKVRIAGINEKRSSKAAKIAEIEGLLSEITGSIERNSKEIKEIELEIRECGQAIDRSKNELEALLLHIAASEEELKRLKELLAECREELEKREMSVKELLKEIDGLSGEKHRLDVELAKLQLAAENISKRLLEEYQIDAEEAKKHYNPDAVTHEMEREIRSLRNRIKALGNVNLDSIEEYKSVKERYDFLSVQHADLTEAKESLDKVISEIDGITKERFMNTFERVREEFKGMFTRLFDGGVADLILTDPDNPLETGVEILAQPPGKKLQSLSLLSGGERAMTAICLLFSLLQVRPSPFCVLDEIDSALDDANVDRYARLLKELSENTQFIVVTHRKGTMEYADSLYGVTMEESGISKIISVKLNEKAG